MNPLLNVKMKFKSTFKILINTLICFSLFSDWKSVGKNQMLPAR